MAKPDTTLFSDDAEQALLGAILYDNQAYHAVAEYLRPEHFQGLMHDLIYDACRSIICAGQVASPVTIDAALKGHDGYKESKIRDYLITLASTVPALVSAPDYGRIIFEFALKRDALGIAQDLGAGIRSLAYDDDALSVIGNAERALQDLQGQGARRQSESLGRDSEDWFTETLEPQSDIPGYRTGLNALDKAIGGLQGNSLFVLAGRPSMGKTALALGLARGACYNKTGVHIASMEMDRKKLWHRMLSDCAREHTKVPYSELGRRRLHDDEREALALSKDIVKALPVYVDDQSGRTVEQVAASARRSKRMLNARGFPLGLVVVDYLQLMKLDRGYASNPSIAIGLQTKAMKELAEQLECTVLLLSQLNREVEKRDDKRPTMADLRQSGEIEQDADVIGLILRPEFYVERDEKSTDEDKAEARGVMRLFLDKNRQGNPDTLKFDCDIACNAVRNAGDLYPSYDHLKVVS